MLSGYRIKLCNLFINFYKQYLKMAKIPSPIPGYIPNESYSQAIEPYSCLREGFVSCFDFATNTEGCVPAGDARLQNGQYFCTDVISDQINKYSMLGGGAAGVHTCPGGSFLTTLSNEGESEVFEF